MTLDGGFRNEPMQTENFGEMSSIGSECLSIQNDDKSSFVSDLDNDDNIAHEILTSIDSEEHYDLHSLVRDESADNVVHIIDGIDGVGFHGRHYNDGSATYSEEEIKSHIHEADDKIDYYKSRIEERKERIRLSGGDTIKISSANSDIAGFEKDLSKWKSTKNKWEDMLSHVK